MRARATSRGVMLLEVLLALTLFVISAAVVGSALRTAMGAIGDMHRQTQAANLAQSVLADLATGRIEVAQTPPTPYGEEDEDPDELWTYEILTEDLTDAEDLVRVTVIVQYADPVYPCSCRLTQWLRVLPAEDGQELEP